MKDFQQLLFYASIFVTVNTSLISFDKVIEVCSAVD